MDPLYAAKVIAFTRDLTPIEEFYELLDVNPVLYQRLKQELAPGLCFFFRGHVLLNCERFCFNFLVVNKDNDIALNVNTRLPQNCIARNSKLRKKWGPEETASALPFQLKRGQNFIFQVLVTHDVYMISVNSFHFASYKHRIPYDFVRAVEVSGDVTNVRLDSYFISEYPTRLPISLSKPIAHYNEVKRVITKDREIHHMPSEWLKMNMASKWLHMSKRLRFDLPVPFYGNLPEKAFTPGRTLRIDGRVRVLPDSFVIDLQTGQDIWPQPPVAFRLCPKFLNLSRSRLGKAVVSRNAFVNGRWLLGESSHLQTTLGPGKEFHMLIVATEKAFEVYVNNKFLVDYKFRMSPDNIDTVNIRGDLKLWDVALESSTLIQHRKDLLRNFFFKNVSAKTKLV